jgi:restriction system protein
VLKGSNKGVFITTSQFPVNTEDIISRSQNRIILIDGKKLVELMTDYDIGVTTEKEYKIKKIDSDYFPEE